MNAKNSLHLRLNSYLTAGLLTLGMIALGAIAPQQAQAANVTGGKTTANSYVTNVAGNGGYAITPLLTVGDEVALIEGDIDNFTVSDTLTFAMAGIPDGLGLFKSEGLNYVFMNHEISPGNTSDISSTIDGQIRGSRVSLFVFDQDWNAIGGKNLIDTAVDSTGTYSLDTVSGNYIDPITNATLNFNRFCSGYLASMGFENAPIYFAPEEAGPEGRGWAVTPNGTAQALEGLGRFSKEQVFAASQYRAENSDRTVLLSTEDFADGEVYMFVGEQTADDPNGFEDGDLFVLKVSSVSNESLPEDQQFQATWVQVPDNIARGTGTELSDWVNAEERSTNFIRPEDIHEDPTNPGTFYFVTTGRDGTENPNGKLYRFSLNPNDPTGEITNFELLLTGGFGNGISYDNMVVDSNGKVLIQEDPASNEADAVLEGENRDSRVLSYDTANGEVAFLFEIDQTAANVEFERGAWETSGIIEVDPNALPGRSSYLFDVQASTISDPRYVRGGQLILTTPVPEPGTTTALSLFGLTALGLKLKRQRRGA